MSLATPDAVWTRVPTLAVIIAALWTSPALAQQTAVVTGHVIEQGTNTAIPNATVILPGLAPALTATDGGFRFDAVPFGRYVLTVQALGWTADDVSLVVRGDTAIVIALQRAPVQLDTLGVTAKNITIKGVVKDSATGFKLVDVDVYGEKLKTTTDPIGRFKVKDVPRNTPFTLRFEEIGYVPMNIAIVASGDTSIAIDLRPDRVAMRMMETAKARLSQRSAERANPSVPVVTREDLLRNVNRSVLEVLDEFLRTRAGRVSCYIIDEKYSSLNKHMLETMLPDRVEHIEVIEFGSSRDELMVRVFTRDYFPSVMVRASSLIPQTRLMQYAKSGNCR